MFIEADLETFLTHLNHLTPEAQPKWGTMGPQRMVEHLTDTLRMATGKNPQKLEIPEEKIERMQAFLETEKPMMQNVAVSFARPDMELRNEELELAIDEFVDEWLYFEELFEANPGMTALHPFYGELNYEQWKRLSQKHHTHHFLQFGLVEE